MNFSFLFDFVADYKSIRRFSLEVTNFKRAKGSRHDFEFYSEKISYYKVFKKWLDENQSKMLRIINDKLYIQKPDIISSNVIIKKNDNLENFKLSKQKKFAA